MQKNKTKNQVQGFIKLARELECDESEESFGWKMKQILSVKPEKKKGSD